MKLSMDFFGFAHNQEELEHIKKSPFLHPGHVVAINNICHVWLNGKFEPLSSQQVFQTLGNFYHHFLIGDAVTLPTKECIKIHDIIWSRREETGLYICLRKDGSYKNIPCVELDRLILSEEPIYTYFKNR